MSKVLVVDDERSVRRVLVQILLDAGYEVIEAKDGSEALEFAFQEQPDVILLDIMMPVIDGFEVLKQIREDPGTGDIPVVLLSALPVLDGEQNGMSLGADHYMTKPWRRELLERTVRVAIRGNVKNSAGDRAEVEGGEGGPALNQGLEVAPGEAMIRTADLLVPLEQKLDGGLRLGTLSLIEGTAASGQSVLSQHLAFGSLVDNHRVAYFSTEHSATSLGEQMASLGMDVSKYLRGDRLRVFPLQEPPPGEDPAHFLVALDLEMDRLPNNFELVVVDNITTMATPSQDPTIFAGFLSSCQQLCRSGKTIILVIHSHAFDEGMLGRLRLLADTHIRLRTGRFRTKLVHMLDVVKVNNVEVRNDGPITFQVEAGTGMRITPMSSVKA